MGKNTIFQSGGKASGSNYLTAVVILLLLFLPATVFAGDIVHGGHLAVNGREITLSLQIDPPPPATLIVTQQLPPGTAIETSSPPFKSYKNKQGKVKWLLSAIKPGKLDIRLTLANAVPGAAVSSVVSYRHPVDGTMTTIEITHP